MSLLTHNSTPAERARGCTFAETFESAQAVVQNGGVIFGTPDIDFGANFDIGPYIRYNRWDLPKFLISGTIWVRVKIRTNANNVRIWGSDDSKGMFYEHRTYLDTGTDQLGLYFGNTSGTMRVIYPYLGSGSADPMPYNEVITIAATWTNDGTNTTYNAYANGELKQTNTYLGLVTELDGYFLLGDRDGTSPLDGIIYDFKVFDQALTAQELLDLHNNTTYTYENECSLYLPMGADQHDPTNARTLDVSGNARHATFGDGSTPATYPTKIGRHHGYNHAGTGYLVVPSSDVVYASALTTMIEFTPRFEPQTNVYYFLMDGTSGKRHGFYHGPLSNSYNLNIMVAGTTVGALTVGTYAPLWKTGGRNIIVSAGVSGDTDVWFNDVSGPLANFGLAWGGDNDVVIYIGSTYTPSAYILGDINSVRIWKKRLTNLQIQNMMIRTLGKVNDVGA